MNVRSCKHGHEVHDAEILCQLIAVVRGVHAPRELEAWVRILDAVADHPGWCIRQRIVGRAAEDDELRGVAIFPGLKPREGKVRREADVPPKRFPDVRAQCALETGKGRRLQVLILITPESARAGAGGAKSDDLVAPIGVKPRQSGSAKLR